MWVAYMPLIVITILSNNPLMWLFQYWILILNGIINIMWIKIQKGDFK